MSFFKQLTVIAFALAALLGCGGAAFTTGTAQLRAISAITSPSEIDVYTDTGAVGTSLGAGDATGFSSHPSQFIGVTVRPGGSSTPLVSGSLNLGVNQRYTLFPYQTDNAAYDMVALAHNAGIAPAGKFRLRIAHLDRFIGSVDVYFAAPGVNLSQETPVIQGVAFESASAYVDLGAGVDRELTITLAGTTTAVGNAIDVNAGSGTARTLLLYDDGGAIASMYAD